MANVDSELRQVEDARSDMQQDEGRFALVHAYDGICSVLLAILQEMREMREEAKRGL